MMERYFSESFREKKLWNKESEQAVREPFLKGEENESRRIIGVAVFREVQGGENEDSDFQRKKWGTVEEDQRRMV